MVRITSYNRKTGAVRFMKKDFAEYTEWAMRAAKRGYLTFRGNDGALTFCGPENEACSFVVEFFCA